MKLGQSLMSAWRKVRDNRGRRATRERIRQKMGKDREVRCTRRNRLAVKNVRMIDGHGSNPP